MRSRSFLFVTLPLAAGMVGPLTAGELEFGGAAVLGLPRGDFSRDADEAYGLSGFMTYGHRDSALRLRLDGSAEIYGSETRRVAISPRLNRITADEVTDNWIGSLTMGPEVTLGRGGVRPYLHGFGGVSYFVTSTEARLGYDYPFAYATNHEDTTYTWGGEAGLRFDLGRELALDVGARYAGHGRVTYLAEGDLRDVPGGVTFATRRSEPRVLEVRVGLRFR
jgi:opacity protein-like surface antigen